MDFNFSEDQQQLRDAVRRWVGKAYETGLRHLRGSEEGPPRTEAAVPSRAPPSTEG